MGSQAAGQLVPAVSATSPPSPVSDILDRLPRLVRRSTGDFVRPRTDPQVFIEHELDVDLLDGLHKWLWLAGRVDNIRPLHHQKLLGRTVMITERAKAHLIWTEDKIFLKPLPEWMTNQAFSNKYIPERSLLRRRTNGFIRTWLYLVQHESDFLLAKELDLLPQKMDWTGWLNFVDANHHLVLQDVSSRTPRYAYGELRLYRINLLYRFLPPWRSDRFFRGYLYGNANYQAWFRRNFAWLVIIFIYITVILTAMQLGLATPELVNNAAFHQASYGFAVFSIFLPLVVIIYVLVMSTIMVAYNIGTTLLHVKQDDMVQTCIEPSAEKPMV